MARNYPRKQTASIFFICLVVVFATFVWVNGWPNTKRQVSYTNPNGKTEVIANNTDILDEEAEWKKSFFENQEKTDPKILKSVKTSAPAPKETLNPTDLFGRNFFTKYTELRRSGQTANTSAVDQATSQLIGESLSGIKGPTLYELKDIKTSTNSDLETTKKYGESLMRILKDWMPAKNEVDIVTSALESGNMEQLKQIDTIITGYKTAVSRLRATIVPETLALPHLNLINGISMQVFNAQSLRNADKDPLTALAAVSLEVKSLQAIAGAIAQMQKAFAQAGITFVVPPSGSILQSR